MLQHSPATLFLLLYLQEGFLPVHNAACRGHLAVLELLGSIRGVLSKETNNGVWPDLCFCYWFRSWMLYLSSLPVPCTI